MITDEELHLDSIEKYRVDIKSIEEEENTVYHIPIWEVSNRVAIAERPRI